LMAQVAAKIGEKHTYPPFLHRLSVRALHA
jgi:hypothetical protein